jgi:hypothetical protein
MKTLFSGPIKGSRLNSAKLCRFMRFMQIMPTRIFYLSLDSSSFTTLFHLIFHVILVLFLVVAFRLF